MIRHIEKGEYVYVPAQTFLYRFEDNDHAHYSRVAVVKQPAYLMFLRENESDTRLCDVFYEGNVWSLFRDAAYPAGEESETRH